jgi:hypothetical protein
MKTFVCFLLLAVLAVCATADINVTGKWAGSFNPIAADGTSKESTAVMVLKQNGTEITGTVGPNEEKQFAIQKGKIEGDKITLEVQDDNNHLIKFDLVIADERIKGNANMSEDGESRKAKLDVSRMK